MVLYKRKNSKRQTTKKKEQKYMDVNEILKIKASCKLLITSAV